MGCSPVRAKHRLAGAPGKTGLRCGRFPRKILAAAEYVPWSGDTDRIEIGVDENQRLLLSDRGTKLLYRGFGFEHERNPCRTVVGLDVELGRIATHAGRSGDQRDLAPHRRWQTRWFGRLGARIDLSGILGRRVTARHHDQPYPPPRPTDDEPTPVTTAAAFDLCARVGPLRVRLKTMWAGLSLSALPPVQRKRAWMASVISPHRARIFEIPILGMEARRRLGAPDDALAA